MVPINGGDPNYLLSGMILQVYQVRLYCRDPITERQRMSKGCPSSPKRNARYLVSIKPFSVSLS